MGEMINSISLKNFMELRDKGVRIALVDVRKRLAYETSGQIIHGAVWQDHEQVELWGIAFAGDMPVIAYCVHGHEVSQNATAKLCAVGVNACYLQGGFDAWLAAGGDVTHLPDNRNIKGSGGK